MTTLPIILTFFPDRDLLIRNVAAIIDYVDKVIIWENTPADRSPEYRFIDDTRVEYCSNGVNSISKALNYAWRYAKNNGYDMILTMDQDSCFEDFGEYLKWVEEVQSQKKCICSPWYYDRTATPQVLSREHVITSGMVVPVEILDAIGGYCEDFDVEAIDIDLCLRARQAGYEVLQNSACILEQHFGQWYKKTVFGHTFSGPGYGSKRLRGIFRNYILTYRRNGRPEWLLKQIHWNLVNYTKNVIFCEPDKVKKLFAIISGFCEGWLIKC